MIPNKKPSSRLLKPLLQGGLLLLLSCALALGAQETWKTLTLPKQTSPFKDRPPKEDTLVRISEKLAQKLNNHGKLPERSPLGLSLLGDSQITNNLKMKDLMEILAIEAGSSSSLAYLKTLQQNAAEERKLMEQLRSHLPEVSQESQRKLSELKKENELLKKRLQETLNKEGFSLSTQAIEDLCKSPNAQDHASLLAAFHHIKTITGVMEKRLRAYPSTEEAQKYYATQFLLLACLDKIQTDLIQRILDVHLPKTLAIQKEAELTAQDAQRLLNNPKSALAPHEKQILETNIQTCEKTRELSLKTQNKLQHNLSLLQEARRKTQQSVQTAQNSHRTVLLRNELLQVDLTHNKEIETLQQLIVPEMLAISFANPERPEILPILQQTPPLSPR